MIQLYRGLLQLGRTSSGDGISGIINDRIPLCLKVPARPPDRKIIK
jgi:hypothetical protein